MRVHRFAIKTRKRNIGGEELCSEQQGHGVHPAKSPLGPSWACVSRTLTLDGVLVDWHPQVTAFLPLLHNVVEPWGSPSRVGAFHVTARASLVITLSHLSLGGKTQRLCGRQRGERGVQG